MSPLPDTSTPFLPSPALTSVVIFAVAVGCATPEPETADDSATDFTPWTADRIGHHPGELGPTSVSTVDTGGDELSAAPDLHHRRQRKLGASDPITATATFAWHLYTHSLSRVTGDTCRFSPSCSRFAVEAVGTGIDGPALAFARLQRNHLDDDRYDVTEDGYLRNPPSDYFFWRTDEGLDAHRTDMPTAHAWYVFVRAAEASTESNRDD